jgi:hypothetical protein
MKLVLPLFVDLPRKRGKPKRVYLNFNATKALHFHIYNDAKHKVLELVRDQLERQGWSGQVPTPVCVTCTLYNSGAREQDVDNCFIAEKFALDAVVSLGYLPDDNVKYVKRIIYEYGGKTSDPRIEIQLDSL